MDSSKSPDDYTHDELEFLAMLDTDTLSDAEESQLFRYAVRLLKIAI